MTKKILRNAYRTVPLAERWPQGWSELSKDSAELGFKPWVPRHSRLFADWNLDGFAVSVGSSEAEGDDARSLYVYCAPNKRLDASALVAMCEQHSFVVLDEK